MHDYERIFRESSEAHFKGDLDTMLEHAADDYVWYHIGSDGPVVGSRNKAEARRNLEKSLQDPNFIEGGMADEVMVFGNLVVGVGRASYKKDGAVVEHRALGVYEYKDGKLQRAWSFPITEED